jgi:hypothetical protein
MHVEIGTEAALFLFWEYVVRMFGNVSLQCITNETCYRYSTLCDTIPARV